MSRGGPDGGVSRPCVRVGGSTPARRAVPTGRREGVAVWSSVAGGCTISPVAPTWAFLSQLDPRKTAGQPARVVVGHLHRAIGELRRVTRRDPARAVEGGVVCLERIPAAVEPVEDPLGSVAAEVVRTIDAVVPLLAAAPEDGVDARLERLWALLQADALARLGRLGEHWGALCRGPERARAWALRLSPALAGEPAGSAVGVACLSSHVAAGMLPETLALLAERPVDVWPERQFGVLALATRGEVDAALTYAVASNPLGHRHDREIAAVCERVLLAAGRRDEAYGRFAFAAHARQNCLQTFKGLSRVYPEVAPSQLLADLLAASAGHEGRWFATACALRFHELAAELATRSPSDPRTLCRHGQDRLDADPEFARAVALAALKWIAAGHGVEISGDDVFLAYDLACAAGERLGAAERTRGQVAAVLDQPTAAAAWAQQLLRPDLGG